MATRNKNRPDTDTLLVMLESARRLAFEGETITPDDLSMAEFPTPDEAVQLYRRAQLQKQAADAVAKAAAQHLGRILGKGGAARYGDTIVRYGQPWKEECFDPYGFWLAMTHLVESGAVKLQDLCNPNQVRKSALPQAVRDTFFNRTDLPETVTAVPRNRAPKFLQALDDGDVVLGHAQDQD